MSNYNKFSLKGEQILNTVQTFVLNTMLKKHKKLKKKKETDIIFFVNKVESGQHFLQRGIFFVEILPKDI